jgi:hypothetical protein
MPEVIPNPPQVGRCNYCDRLSVRLLNAPLVKIPSSGVDDYHFRLDDVVWFRDNDYAPPSMFEVVEGGNDEFLICLAPEAHRDRKYCFKCFDGHLWPSLRQFVINMPREMTYNPDHPWWTPKWSSYGREQPRTVKHE